jgi:hypothetical protein
MDQYNTIFADPKKWLEEGWVDYLSPQLYWPIESEGQPFVPLLTWWTEQNRQGRHIWPGLYTGKYSRDQIRRQVEASRSVLGATAGHIHFSQKTFNKDRGTTFVQTIYQDAALAPESSWMRLAAPVALKARAKPVDPDTLEVLVDGESLAGSRQWVAQYLKDGEWGYKIVPSSETSARIPRADRVFVFGVNRVGKAGRRTPVGPG